MRILVSLLALFLFVPLALGYAQTAADNSAHSSFPTGATSCFDHYAFGEIETVIQGELSSVAAGTPLFVTGTIKNNGEAVVSDGTLHARILKKGLSSGGTPTFDTLDQFVAVENIELAPGSERPVAFTWEIPRNALPGQYQVVTFFSVSERFGLDALSFTGSAQGATHDFGIVNETSKGIVSFDTAEVYVNSDTVQRFVNAPVRIVKNQPEVVVRATVRSSVDRPVEVPVEWKLYRWDSIKNQDVIDTQTSIVQLHPNSESVVEYTIRDTGSSVYQVVGTLDYKGLKSLILPRFVREGVDEVRLAYAGLETYPVVAGEANTLFFCAHNTGFSQSIDGARVELSVLNDDAVILRSVQKLDYEGPVTSELMAVAKDFTARTSTGNITIRADLYQGATVVDSIDTQYSCEALLGSDRCGQLPQSNMLFIVAGAVGAGVLLLVILLIIFLNRKGEEIEEEAHIPELTQE